jgi:hypothetical protein
MRYTLIFSLDRNWTGHISVVKLSYKAGLCPGPRILFLHTQEKYPKEERPDENYTLRAGLPGRVG